LPATLPATLIEGIARLCQGEFSYRLLRTRSGDAEDQAAFLFNTLAEELERILANAKEQEQRLSSVVEALSDALTRVAAGDLEAQVERDFRGDAVDVLAFLVNNTIAELAALIAERARRSEEDRQRLEQLVERRTAEVKQSEENFRRLFDAAPVPMILVDTQDISVRSCNEQAALALDAPLHQVVGSSARELFENEDDFRAIIQRIRERQAVDGFAVQLRSFGGRVFWCLLNARTLTMGEVPIVMASFADFTEQKLVEDRLRELANHDPMTGLLNRRAFFEATAEELARVTRYRRTLCLAMLDLDHFKSINDRFGHAIGDEALRAVASSLGTQLRRQDRIGRYGGEEFAVALPETGLETAREVLDRCRVAIEALGVTHPDGPIRVTISVGVVEAVERESLGALLRRADAALYAAKAQGRNRVVVA
jgi:diguanylate cyclase (GGDEF)-like protein/PAS domain S-box-containing protein